MRNHERHTITRTIIALTLTVILSAFIGNAYAQEEENRGVDQLAFYLATESDGTLTDCPVLQTWGYVTCFRLNNYSQTLAKLQMELALMQPRSRYDWYGPWAESDGFLFRFINEEFVVTLAPIARDILVLITRIP